MLPPRSEVFLPLWIASSIALGIATTSPAPAQPVVPDATLPVNSVVTTQGNTSKITGGTRAGRNLFHSFREFSVPTLGVAHFDNALDILNIISRVTGTSASNINGSIKANGGANLFLINPNGIIFGPHASLNIGGSFLASTASSLKFADGIEFSATTPEATPLLTMSVPMGLQLAASAGNITNQSMATDSQGNPVGLQVMNGNNLTLVGGNVSLEGGKLTASGGRVELGGLSEAGLVGFNSDGSLSFPVRNVERGDVSLTNQALVYVTAGNAGSINITARNIDLQQSRLQAGIGKGLGAVGNKAGNVTLNATNAISLSQTSAIANQVYPNATGDAGDINVTAGTLAITDGAYMNASTFGQGNAGNLNIQVSGNSTFDGVAQAFSSVATGARGNGGDITIASRSLSLSNGALLESSIFGMGNAGRVSVQTDGDISLAVLGGIFSTVESGAVGNAGTIDIKSTAGSLKVTAGAELETYVMGTGAGSTPPTSSGEGNAGSINIQVGKDISFDGLGQVNGETFLSEAISTVGPGTRGNAGDIKIAARSLSLTNGALLTSNTFGTGNAGSVNINARDGVSFDGAGSNGVPSGVYVPSSNNPETNPRAGDITVTTTAFHLTHGAILDSQNSSPSNGGNVTINATTFEATNGGQVLTSTASSGKAGDIILHVTDSVTLSGSDPTYQKRLQQFGPDAVNAEGASSGLFAITDNGSIGKGGTISIDPINLTIANGAQVAVSSLGQGEAGYIFLQARAITLDQGFVSARAASGNGGSIFVQAPESLLMRHGSQISATAGIANGGGNGGNISIDNTVLVIAFPTEGSDISANAFRGNGGSVKINAAGIFGFQSQPAGTPFSAITASSTGGGINGVVNINTLDVDPSRGLVVLPVILADSSKQIVSGCAAGNGTTGSRFVVTGRGGLPSNPSEPLSSEAVWSDTRFVAATGEQHSQTVSAPQPSPPATVAIVPATGWVFNGKGDVTLTAAVPSERIQVPWLTPASCQAR